MAEGEPIQAWDGRWLVSVQTGGYDGDDIVKMPWEVEDTPQSALNALCFAEKELRDCLMDLSRQDRPDVNLLGEVRERWLTARLELLFLRGDYTKIEQILVGDKTE